MVVFFFYHSAILCLTNNKWKIRKEKSFLTIQSSWKIKKHREQKIKQYQRRILKKKDFQLFFYLFWRIFLLLLGFLWVYSFFIIILYMRYNSEVKIFLLCWCHLLEELKFLRYFLQETMQRKDIVFSLLLNN